MTGEHYENVTRIVINGNRLHTRHLSERFLGKERTFNTVRSSFVGSVPSTARAQPAVLCRMDGHGHAILSDVLLPALYLHQNRALYWDCGPSAGNHCLSHPGECDARP